MSQSANDVESLETLADRLAEIAEALIETDQSRDDLVDEAVGALREHGVGESFFGRRVTVGSNGAVSLSRPVANKPAAALFRPDDLEEYPSIIKRGPSPLSRTELGELLRTSANEYRSLARPPEELNRELIMLLANEPECLFQDHTQSHGKLYLKTRLGDLEGTILAQVLPDDEE